MDKAMAILSAGANGSCIGADLTKAGHNVVLIDHWPAHVDAMKSRGLQIIFAEKQLDIPVKAFHLCELCTFRHQFDIIFLVAKSYDTHWMVEFIKPYLKPDGVLVSLQNSLNDEWIAPVIGYQRDIASAVELASNMFEPGIVRRSCDQAHTWFALGELHGRVTPRLQEIAEILSAAGKVETSTNIWGAKWSKLMVNCMTMAFSTILGISDQELMQDDKLLNLSIGLGKEVMHVGTALGYKLEPIFGMSADSFLGSGDEVLKKHLVALYSAMSSKTVNAIRQDYLRGRCSETEFLNGLVARKGQEAKIPTPLNDAITSLSKQIDQRILEPKLSNLSIFEKMIEPCKM